MEKKEPQKDKAVPAEEPEEDEKETKQQPAGKLAAEPKEEPGPLTIKGVHLDICRHFISCKTILELVKLMHTLGFNTLHLHLSDDQSIPFESGKYPQLKSAPMLTLGEQTQISQACEAAGIQVIPEIDIPGHLIAFLHAFHPETVPEEKKLGLITTRYLDLEKDLLVILDLYEELAKRFKSKYIHMGGDEAKGFKDFPKLVTTVCKWADERKLKVVAWDEVANFFDQLEGGVPANLVIQRWRFRASPKCSQAPCILSQGYYLDHCDDPIDYYRRSPKALGKNIGCITCIWTELIDENNLWYTILPTLYMLAQRWNDFPAVRKDQPVLLYELCEKHGYPKSPLDDTWKRRLWVGFYQEHARSTSSVTTETKLTREHDLYPVFSRRLIKTQCVLYRHCVLDEKVPEKELDEAVDFVCEGTQKDVSFLKSKPKNWKKMAMDTVAQVKYKEDTYCNGMIDILKRLAARK